MPFFGHEETDDRDHGVDQQAQVDGLAQPKFFRQFSEQDGKRCSHKLHQQQRANQDQ